MGIIITNKKKVKEEEKNQKTKLKNTLLKFQKSKKRFKG